ncbi:hypothetical protein D3C87_1179590 [compost metagenome]
MLPGRHHLPGLGAPRRDHCFVVGTQFGVGQLVLALIDRGAGLIEGSLGGFKVGVGRIELGLRAYPAIEQSLLPAGGGLRIDELCIDFCQVALGRTQLVLLVGWIERGEQRALLDLGPDIDITTGDSPAHTEPGIALVARLDTAGETPQILFVQGLNLDRQHRPYRLRRWLAFGTGAQHQPNGQRP